MIKIMSDNCLTFHVLVINMGAEEVVSDFIVNFVECSNIALWLLDYQIRVALAI